MTKSKESSINFCSPPGGLMIWIFILSELFVYAMALISFLFEKSINSETFENSRAMLNQSLAFTNTLILITSGYCIAQASDSLHRGRINRAIKWITGASALGFMFLLFKMFEFQQKLEAGIVLGTNDFYDYYWILTVFHAIHVLIGLGILIFFLWAIKHKYEFKEEDLNYETGFAFWHMCDLIWLLLYPVIYLI